MHHQYHTALVAMLLIAGCNSRPATLDLQGEIAYAGVPIAWGKIHFVPTQNTPGHAAVATIANGQYQLPAKWGLLDDGVYIVRIEGYRKTGQKVRQHTGEMVDEVEQYIPEAHNKSSTRIIRVADLPNKKKLDFQIP